MAQKVFIGGYQILNMEGKDISLPGVIEGLYKLVSDLDKPILINNFYINTKAYKPVYVMFNFETDGSLVGNAIITEGGNKSVITFKILDDDTFSATIEKLSGGGSGSEYTAGNGVTIADNTISTKIEDALRNPSTSLSLAEINPIKDGETITLSETQWSAISAVLNNNRQVVVSDLVVVDNSLNVGLELFTAVVDVAKFMIMGVGMSVEGIPYGITILYTESAKSLTFYIKNLTSSGGSGGGETVPQYDLQALGFTQVSLVNESLTEEQKTQILNDLNKYGRLVFKLGNIKAATGVNYYGISGFVSTGYIDNVKGDMTDYHITGIARGYYGEPDETGVFYDDSELKYFLIDIDIDTQMDSVLYITDLTVGA